MLCWFLSYNNRESAIIIPNSASSLASLPSHHPVLPGNLSEKEFRVMIVKNFQNIENRREKMQEAFKTFNKVLEEIKNKQ